ncbi:CRAL-TRIO lipid binding protein [Gracilaria domingensis]|nr:CRAL-TRIO lipid binding protein [Gracilaria domingensis]
MGSRHTDDLSHLQHNAAPPTGVASVLSTIRSIGASHTVDTVARVTHADLSAPFIRSAEEENKLVQSLRQAAAQSGNQSVANADHFWLLAALRARKGDVKRAEQLMLNFLAWKRRLAASTDRAERLRAAQKQLQSRVVFVSGHTDRDQRPVINVRLPRHDPSTFSALDTVRTLALVMEWTMRTYPAAQTHGVIIVHNFANLKFHNLDLRLPGELQNTFSQTFPVRVAAILICHPPFFLKGIIGLVTAIMGKKIKARIRAIDERDKHILQEYLESDQIMDDVNMGGTAAWNSAQHSEWVERIGREALTWPDPTECQ